MPLILLRRIGALVFPGGLLLVGLGLALRRRPLPAPWPALTDALPLIALAVGAALSLRFNRGRLALGVFLLAGVDRLLPTLAEGALPGQLLPALLAIDLALLGLWADRRLLSFSTLLLAVFLGSQALLPWFLQESGRERMVTGWLEQRLWNGWTPGGGLTQVELAIFAASAVVLVARFSRHRDALDAGFVWALAASLLALATVGDGEARRAWLGAGGVALCAAAVERSHRLAYRDGLTGLPTRRALEEDLQTLRGRYAVAMVDVDHFKGFNDRYGHEIGDQALRRVASHLERVRGGGRAYRYGGEEFAVLFRRRDAATARAHLETLRRDIAGSAFTVRAPGRRSGRRGRGRAGGGRRSVKLTVSVGLAEPSARAGQPMEVLKAADAALYRAKAEGRNRVVA